MTPAHIHAIIKIIAGPETGAPGRLAAMLGVPRPTVYSWVTRSSIPSDKMRDLLQLARDHNRPLRAEHFFDPDLGAAPGPSDAVADPPQMPAPGGLIRVA